MKKIWILFLLLPLLLCSCATGEVSCGVDGNHNAYLTLSLQASWEGTDDEFAEEIRLGFIAIAKHFRDELGFEVEESITRRNAALTMRRIRPAQTDQEAFQALEAMLTDQTLTPFMEVRMHAADGTNFQGYRTEVTLDAAGFLSAMELDHMPAALSKYVTQSIRESSLEVNLTLPGQEIVASSGPPSQENGLITVSSPVSFDSPTTLSLTTTANTSGETAETLEAQVKATQTRIWIFGGLLVLFAAGLAVSIFCIREKDSSDYDW